MCSGGGVGCSGSGLLGRGAAATQQQGRAAEQSSGRGRRVEGRSGTHYLRRAQVESKLGTRPSATRRRGVQRAGAPTRPGRASCQASSSGLCPARLEPGAVCAAARPARPGVAVLESRHACDCSPLHAVSASGPWRTCRPSLMPTAQPCVGRQLLPSRPPTPPATGALSPPCCVQGKADLAAPIVSHPRGQNAMPAAPHGGVRHDTRHGLIRVPISRDTPTNTRRASSKAEPTESPESRSIAL